VEGNPGVADQASLDSAWKAVWTRVAGPGSPRELLSTGRPTLIIAGGNDPFGRPSQFPPVPPHYGLVGIRAANHMFAIGASAAGPAALEQLTDAATAWIDRRLPAAHS
jgi:hypothetical protein